MMRRLDRATKTRPKAFITRVVPPGTLIKFPNNWWVTVDALAEPGGTAYQIRWRRRRRRNKLVSIRRLR